MSIALLSPGGGLAKSEAAKLTAPRSAAHLKICFISETVHSGVGRHIADAISALSPRGHEIHLLYSPIRSDAQLLGAIKQQPNVRCNAVSMPREIGFGDAEAFNRIRAYVRRMGPFDILHGHSAKGGGYARLLKLLGVGPVVYTPHAFITQSPVLPPMKRFAYRAIETTLGRFADRVICGSQLEREHARELGIGDERLAVIPNGIGSIAVPLRETVRRNLGLTDDQIAVGFVGRMDHQKAPERLVAAACELLPAMPNLTFLMIGEGPRRPELEAMLRSAGLTERVRWLGAINARHCMPAFDMLAVSSHYEGFAYVLIEALYAGLPVVSTLVGGTHETIEHGVNGFIAPHGTSGELAEAIRRIADDPALRHAMGAESRKRAEHFSILGMADAMELLYRRLLAAPQSAAQAPSQHAIETRPAALESGLETV